MAAGGIQKPIDVLYSDLEFLQEYLEQLADRFDAEGKAEDAEVARGWSELPEEAAERISQLASRT
jgi:hypothetical protein